MTQEDNNTGLREAATIAIMRLIKEGRDLITWSEIARGFNFRGQRIYFATKALGIFKPAQLNDGAALSLRTSNPSRPGRNASYDDAVSYEGVFRYRLQGNDPANHHNQLLFEAWRQHLPLIYFFLA